MKRNLIKNVTVFAASSDNCDESFLSAADALGMYLADKKIRIFYGG